MVERCVRDAEVGGSNPLTPTISSRTSSRPIQPNESKFTIIARAGSDLSGVSPGPAWDPQDSDPARDPLDGRSQEPWRGYEVHTFPARERSPNGIPGPVLDCERPAGVFHHPVERRER